MSRKTTVVAAVLALTLLATVTVLAHRIAASTPQAARSETLRKYIYESFDSWKKINQIDIQTEATERIKEGFLNEQSYLEHIFSRHQMNGDAQRQLFEALVAEYLYDLRDTKMSDTKVPATKSLETPRFREATLRISRPQLVPEPILITVELVASYPVSEFLKKLKPVLDGPGTPGQLEVISTPERESITIDGEGRGDTCKTFVVSPGKHTVTVQGKNKCSGDVVVGEGKTERFCCPKGTGCPKWKDGKPCTTP